MPSEYFTELWGSIDQESFFKKAAARLEEQNKKRKEFFKNKSHRTFRDVIKYVDEYSMYDSDMDEIVPGNEFTYLAAAMFDIFRDNIYEDEDLGFINSCLSIKYEDKNYKFRYVVGQGTIFQIYKDPNPTNVKQINDLSFLDLYIMQHFGL